MKRKFILSIVAIVTALCLGLCACTVKVNDPSITDEKAEPESLQIKAENGTWHEASEEDMNTLFNLVKSLGELSGEALDIAISGSSTIETVYDYSFKLAFSGGNFFVRKKGEFVYNVGERFTRTYSDGKVNERYNADKLVVMKSLSKDTATLTEAQLQTVKDIFEPVNSEIMSEAFEKVASWARDSGYTAEEIAKENLEGVLLSITASGIPNDGEQNLIKGYRIVTDKGDAHIFLTASVDWAIKLCKWDEFSRVGRVCYTKGSYSDIIRDTLKS